MFVGKQTCGKTVNCPQLSLGKQECSGIKWRRFLFVFVVRSLLPHRGADNPDVLEGNLKDRRQHQQEQQEKQQQQRATDSGRLGHTDPAEARDKHAPSSHLQSRRLTLADHPISSASAGSRETIIKDVSFESEAEQRGSGLVEELRAHSAASGTTYPLAGRGEGTPLVPALGTASGNHHARNRVGSRKQGASVEGQGRLSKSVLVLNGAACFVGGRLASTGEPQVNIDNAVGVENRSGLTFFIYCNNEPNLFSRSFPFAKGMNGACKGRGSAPEF